MGSPQALLSRPSMSLQLTRRISQMEDRLQHNVSRSDCTSLASFRANGMGGVMLNVLLNFPALFILLVLGPLASMASPQCLNIYLTNTSQTQCLPTIVTVNFSVPSPRSPTCCLNTSSTPSASLPVLRSHCFNLSRRQTRRPSQRPPQVLHCHH